jgi:hypothetical protein
MRSPLLLCLAAALSFAEGTKPKPAPTDYDVHAADGPVEIGAEYMVHSYSNGEQMFLAERYLIVDVALYPLMKTDEVMVDMSKISLRLNNKTVLQPVDPKEVAASLKPSMWDKIRNGAIGAGPLGKPFPGGGQGPLPPQQRMPNPSGGPDQDPTGGTERHKPDAEEVLLDTALPPGPHKGAVSGFVYFPFRGKPSSLKSVELDYNGVTLKLK